MNAWRILHHAPADGAWNMAVDEALLESACRRPTDRATTLRLYGWSPPSLSLGRKQRTAESLDLGWLHAHGVDVVRRPTGGRAVLHEHERTYAVVGRLRSPAFPGGVIDTYARIARAIRLALRRLGFDARIAPPPSRGGPGPHGPASCFDRPAGHEITVSGRKVVGSSQLRRRGAFLQHGSILLRTDPDRLAGAVGAPVDPSTFAGLEEVAGRGTDTSRLDEELARAFARAFAADLVPGELDDDEAALAARLRCWKYDSAAWTLEGRIGEREGRWGGPLGL